MGTAGAIGAMGDPMAFSCRNCGKPQNRPGLKFCPDCGQPISGAVLPADYQGAAPSGLPGPRRVGLLVALMVTAIAVAGGAGAAAGLLRRPPGPARLTTQVAPAPGLSTQPGTRPAKAAGSTPPRDGASPTPAVSPGQTETGELQQLAAAVRQSSAARRITVSATGGVANCSIGTGAGIAMMNQSIRTREAALSAVSGLSGDSVPAGPALISNLVQAMNYSISADHRFIAWMRHAGSAGTCPAPQNGDPAWDAGLRLSELAMNEKDQFVGAWNPLAARFGLPTYSALNV
jgi:hypothetical protein